MYNKTTVTTLRAFLLFVLMGQMYGMHVCTHVARSGAPKKMRTHAAYGTHRSSTTNSKTSATKPEQLTEHDSALEVFRLLREKIDLEYATKSKKIQRCFRHTPNVEHVVGIDAEFVPKELSKELLLLASLEIKHWNETLRVARLEQEWRKNNRRDEL